MKRIIVISFLTLSSLFSAGQTFEGIITFSITYDSPAEMAEAVALLPNSQTFYIKKASQNLSSPLA